MANGPFGNPLSTGIALSFEVDMTPYREMHKRKLLAAKEKEEDQKKKQQQYADILKNITPPDASKIHKKYMPEVQNQYAELIDSAMGYINKNDMASLYKHMFGFNSNAEKAVQATENYKNYVNSDANKTFKSIEAIRAMEDDNTALSQIAKDYQNDVEYGDGFLHWATIERPDLLGETNKILQGAEKAVVFDGGKPVVMGRMPETDEVIYQESVKDPDKVIDYLSGWLMSSPGGNRLLMDYGGINAGQLDERTPDGIQKREALAREYVSKEIEPKLYGQKISKISQDKESKGWSGGKSDNWSISKTDRPVDLGKEVGDLYGYDVFYTGDKAKEVSRVIQVSQGSYWARGGDEFLKVSDKAEGEGVGVPAVPAGLYIRKDKPKGEGVWAAYKTPYEPPALRGETEAPEGVDPDVWASLGSGDDVDWTKTQSYRTIYVPIKSSSEANAFMATLNMPKEEYDRLIKDVEKEMGTTSGTQSSESEAKKESKRVEVTQKVLESAAKVRGMSINDYKSYLKKEGIEVIVK